MKTCSHSSGFFREWLDVYEMKNAGFAYCFQKFKYKKNVPKDFLYTERKRKNGNSRKDNENRSCNKKNQSHIRKRECKTPDNDSNVICNCSYSDVYGDSCTVYAGLIKLDISDLPALFGTFVYGPLCGVTICLVKNVLHSFATNTVFVGEISNFILGCAFVVPAGMIYQKMKNKKGAIIASLTGSVAMALLSIVSNYFFVYPIYYNFMSKDLILQAYQAIFPGVKSILQALVVFNVPFTLLKGLICVVLAWILYVPLAPILRTGEE